MLSLVRRLGGNKYAGRQEGFYSRPSCRVKIDSSTAMSVAYFSVVSPASDVRRVARPQVVVSLRWGRSAEAGGETAAQDEEVCGCF